MIWPIKVIDSHAARGEWEGRIGRINAGPYLSIHPGREQNDRNKRIIIGLGNSYS
jgi:hypothetical protein